MGTKRRKVVTTPPPAADQPAAGGSAGARAYAAAPTAVVTASLAPSSRLPSVGALDSATVNAHIAGELAQFLTRSAVLLTGPRAEALAASGTGVFAEASLQTYNNTAAMCAGLKTAWHAAGAAQRGIADVLTTARRGFAGTQAGAAARL